MSGAGGTQKNPIGAAPQVSLLTARQAEDTPSWTSETDAELHGRASGPEGPIGHTPRHLGGRAWSTPTLPLTRVGTRPKCAIRALDGRAPGAVTESRRHGNLSRPARDSSRICPQALQGRWPPSSAGAGHRGCAPGAPPAPPAQPPASGDNEQPPERTAGEGEKAWMPRRVPSCCQPRAIFPRSSESAQPV